MRSASPRRDFLSSSEPTNIDMATPETFILMASLMETVVPSSARLPSTLVPPETLNMMGTSTLVSTELLRTPLVSIRQSAYLTSGSIVLPGSSRPEVGPRK